MRSSFIIVGSGISGLFLAEKLSALGQVTLVTKGRLNECNTSLAQGGIAAVRDLTQDDLTLHKEDTLKAGAYHNNEVAVDFLVKNADSALSDLEKLGVVFDAKPTQEGAHSRSRIWHKDDFSGEYIEEALILNVQKNVNIEIWDHAYVFDLIVFENKCQGVKVFDHNAEIHYLEAEYVILASGGAGGLFEKTTNPAVTVGDGIAFAQKHGVKLKDLEFLQFHPTGLDLKRDPMFLLSEALRGEGAKLVNAQGEQFMQNYHSMGDLAPRDIVSRAIYNEQKKGKVYLDMRHKTAEFIRRRFPNISHELRKYDLKLERDLIPITPAAHYLCGGIETDLEGKTSLKNLLAVGEVACTGVHGANRLASNSLLEGVVFARSIYTGLQQELSCLSEKRKIKDPLPLLKGKIIKEKIISKNYVNFLIKVQKIMWEYFGIVRNFNTMQTGKIQLEKLEPQDKISENVKLSALAIAESCLARKESLGCHYIES